MLSLKVCVVIAPDQVVVNIGLVVISKEMAKFVSIVVFEVVNVFDGVVRLIMVAKVMLAKNVLVSFSWIMMLMGPVVVTMVVVEVLAMMVIVVLVEVLGVAVMVILSRC